LLEVAIAAALMPVAATIAVKIFRIVSPQTTMGFAAPHSDEGILPFDLVNADLTIIPANAEIFRQNQAPSSSPQTVCVVCTKDQVSASFCTMACAFETLVQVSCIDSEITFGAVGILSRDLHGDLWRC
jgi:hypothetical protein